MAASLYLRIPSGRLVLASGLLFIASQLFIAFLLHGGGAAHILISLQLCFDAQRFGEILAGLSDRQMAALRMHFWPDMLHPVWYSVFAWLLTRWLLHRHACSLAWCRLLWLAPLMGIMDLVENLLHLPLIYGWSAPDGPSVAIAAACAAVKWALAFFFTIINLGLLAGLLFRSRHGG